MAGKHMPCDSEILRGTRKTQDEIQPKERQRVNLKDAVIFLPSKSVPEMRSLLGKHHSEKVVEV